MKLILLLIMTVLISFPACGAELLVKAEPSWMESIPKEKWSKYGITQEEYDHRWEVGDVVVVKPDNWKWGRFECPPRFVIIKVPQIDVESLKSLEEPLYFGEGKEKKLLKKRKWRFSPLYIEKIKSVGTDTLTIEVLKEKIKERVVENGKVVEKRDTFNPILSGQ